MRRPSLEYTRYSLSGNRSHRAGRPIGDVEEDRTGDEMQCHVLPPADRQNVERVLPEDAYESDDDKNPPEDFDVRGRILFIAGDEQRRYADD